MTSGTQDKFPLIKVLQVLFRATHDFPAPPVRGRLDADRPSAPQRSSIRVAADAEPRITRPMTGGRSRGFRNIFRAMR